MNYNLSDNGSVQRLQMTSATQPETLINPLQQNCYTADRYFISS
jgi:hypothetical protein